MISKETDKLFRNITKDYLEVVVEKFGIDDKVIRLHPTSGLSIDNKNLEMDIVYENQDEIVKDLEFQITKVDENDQYRFLKYNVYLGEYHRKPSEVLVLSAVEPSKEIKLKVGPNLTYVLKIFSIIDVNGDEKLNTIKTKLKNNLKLNISEYIDLVFMGYYNCKNKEKNIESAIRILTNTYDENENIEKLISYQYLMYNKFLKKYKNLEKIKELFEMRLPALEQSLKEREEKGIKIGEKNGIKIGEKNGIKIGEKNGIEKGEIQNSIKNAITMFKKDFSIKQVIEITEIQEETATYLSSLCGNGYTNEQLLNMIIEKYYPHLI